MSAIDDYIEAHILGEALRLERQAEILVARGYRVGELIQRVRWQKEPVSLATGSYSIATVEPLNDLPPARLYLRRIWRRFFPYRPTA